MLADLRESGSIEQDADVVMFIFREEYYQSRLMPMKRSGQSDEQYDAEMKKWQADCDKVYGLAEIIVAKQRHGPIGQIKLVFDAKTTKFDNHIASDQVPSANC
jgi:replicative DNA helicase